MFDAQKFKQYIAQDCNRLEFLRGLLLENGVQTSLVRLEGKNHIYVNFPSSSYNPTFKIKTIISHYDRVSGSPGANDNSFANFALADFAASLIKNPGFAHNIRIFFTDGEELGEEGVSAQGAFALADLFRKLGIKNDDVYVFDSCGRGNVAVLAQAGLSAKTSSQFKKSFLGLYKRTAELLKSSSPHWITLPVPYSDNAGFLACGIPAVAVTFLPEDEVNQYLKNLMADKNLEKAVMNCKIDSASANKTDMSIQRFKYQEKMPNTWRMFHTQMDNFLNLTVEESWQLMMKILENLKRQKVLAS